MDDVEAMARAVVRLFEPHVEVVLHDLAAGTIAAIWNPVSGREVGDESLIDEFDAGAVLGPYPQVDVRGHPTTSVSVPVDGGRKLLCLNFDRSALDGAAALLASFGAAREPQPGALFARDWRSRINELIADWCVWQGLVARDLDRAQRRELVQSLDRQGVFGTRHAAGHVGGALGVSRATVYNLRKETSDDR